jgi:hypothetical protein
VTRKYNYKTVSIDVYRTSEEIDLTELVIKDGIFKEIDKNFKSKFIKTPEGYPLSITLSFNNTPIHTNTIFSTPKSTEASYFFFSSNTGFPSLPAIYPSDITIESFTISIPFVLTEEDPELTTNGFMYRGLKLAQFIKPDTFIYDDEVYESTLQAVYRDITLNSLLNENISSKN